MGPLSQTEGQLEKTVRLAEEEADRASPATPGRGTAVEEITLRLDKTNLLLERQVALIEELLGEIRDLHRKV